MFGQIDPPHRLMTGLGPVNVRPRVLRAMSADMLGQIDPEMTDYMNETMVLYRRVFMTDNRWTARRGRDRSSAGVTGGARRAVADDSGGAVRAAAVGDRAADRGEIRTLGIP